MAAIPASPTTSSRTISRRRNPTRTVTAIRPSHLTSLTARIPLSKVTMYVMMNFANIHGIDMYQPFPGSAIWVQPAPALSTNARKTRFAYHSPNHFGSES
jgi:hypothetical protein